MSWGLSIERGPLPFEIDELSADVQAPALELRREARPESDVDLQKVIKVAARTAIS
ncbi:hypothetical protein WG907_11825 [Sphingobium sp. AN558]|uniref:hypothetical protein n=1 Tax=Sphingobium sp. AN558 TaxID=3133442 RepID=UPI0030BFEFB4